MPSSFIYAAAGVSFLFNAEVFTHTHTHTHRGFPDGTSGKAPDCQCKRLEKHRFGFDPWVRKIRRRRAQQPTPVFLPGESHGRRCLVTFCLSIHPLGCESQPLISLRKKLYWIFFFLIFMAVVLEKTLESPLDCKEIHQSIPKEISPEHSLEGLMLKLKLQYFGHPMQRADSLEKTLISRLQRGPNLSHYPGCSRLQLAPNHSHYPGWSRLQLAPNLSHYPGCSRLQLGPNHSHYPGCSRLQLAPNHSHYPGCSRLWPVPNHFTQDALGCPDHSHYPGCTRLKLVPHHPQDPEWTKLLWPLSIQCK